MSRLLLGLYEMGKAQRILNWARKEVERRQFDPGTTELRLWREPQGSDIHAVLFDSLGQIAGIDKWSFIEWTPPEFEVWFNGGEHSRMMMDEEEPRPPAKKARPTTKRARR